MVKLTTVNAIIAYEQGELNGDEVLQLFARLIRDGLAWTLQGAYGRQAAAFIAEGYISPDGIILRDYEGEV